MDTPPLPRDAGIHVLTIDGEQLDVVTFEPAGARGVVVVAHPTDRFEAAAIAHVAAITGARVVGVNAHGTPASRDASSLERMVAHIEAARRALGVERWTFWGMSGGGWLGQIYAHRHPEALDGVVLESVCASFRMRLADPACALSPLFPAWRDALRAAALFDQGALDDARPLDDVEWVDVAGAGQVLRRRGGAAVLVAPAPLDDAMKRRIPAFWAFDARPLLPRLAAPALVIAGSADPIVPLAHVRALHAAIAGAELVVIEGAGHVPSAQRHPAVTSAFARLVGGAQKAR